MENVENVGGGGWMWKVRKGEIGRGKREGGGGGKEKSDY